MEIRRLSGLISCSSVAAVFTVVMWTMFYSFVRIMCFWSEEGLQRHDFVLNSLVMTVLLLLVDH